MTIFDRSNCAGDVSTVFVVESLLHSKPCCKTFNLHSGDIISDMLKDAPVGASASIIVTTCPILSPAEDGDICKPNKPSDFKVSHVQSAIFGTLLLYTIALITV